MSRKTGVFLAIAILLGSLPALPAAATTVTSSCEDGFQASGAIYRICMSEPGRWNGDLVLYAQGAGERFRCLAQQHTGIPIRPLQFQDERGARSSTIRRQYEK